LPLPCEKIGVFHLMIPWEIRLRYEKGRNSVRGNLPDSARARPADHQVRNFIVALDVMKVRFLVIPFFHVPLFHRQTRQGLTEFHSRIVCTLGVPGCMKDVEVPAFQEPGKGLEDGLVDRSGPGTSSEHEQDLSRRGNPQALPLHFAAFPSLLGG